MIGERVARCEALDGACFSKPRESKPAINGGPFGVVVQVYGPATACLWDDDWDKLDEAEKGARMPWQGAVALSSFSQLRTYAVYKNLWQHRLRREQPFLDGAREIR